MGPSVSPPRDAHPLPHLDGGHFAIRNKTSNQIISMGLGLAQSIGVAVMHHVEAPTHIDPDRTPLLALGVRSELPEGIEASIRLIVNKVTSKNKSPE